MLKNKFLSILFCVSSGSNDENLGSDEHEIIDICNIIIDVNKRQTLDICQYYLRPILKPALSSECTTLTGYTIERIVEQKTIYLEDFLKELDKQLLKLNIHPSQVENEFTFVVDGPLHLRQALIPECTKKDLSLPFFFYEYFDLRREFKKYLSSTTTNSSFSSPHNKFPTLVDIAKYFQIENTNNNGDNEKIYSLKQCRLIEKISHLMLKNGHVFDTPETISRELEHGICSIDDYIEENTIVRVRGLPWQCTDQDVEKFFAGLNIAEGGVALCLSTQGRRNGEALVRFINEEQRNLALRRHKHHIGSRYIEVYRASGKDFLSVAGGSNAEAKTFLSRNGKVIIRMRGLPFDSVAKDVVEFFRNGENSCEILDDESGVLFVHYPDGRATGDAFVMMKSEEEACRALLKHKETMGTRYIELFRSTSAEVQQVFKRSQDPKFYQNSLLMKSDMSLSNSSMASVASSAAALALAAASTPTSSIGPQVNSGAIPLPLLPPEMLSGGGGTKRDCIRLRNLPLECGVEQILEFLGVHSQHILPHGVHMILNAQAQPSGESFIQFDGEQSVYNVCLHKNGKCMYFGGKKYYIEVIQCSGEEMNLVLMGILPSNLINTYASGTIAPAPLIPPPPSLHNYAFKSPKYSAKTSPTTSTSLMRAASGSNSSSPSSYLMISNPNQAAANQFQLPAVPTSAQLTPNLIYPTLNHATNPNGPAQVRAASIGSATSSASSLMAAATGQFANTQPYGPIIWYYPTPPVSPTTSALFYHHSQQSPLLYPTSAPPPPPPPPLATSVNANVAPTTTTTHPCILVVKNAPYNVTVADVMNFFNGYEIIPDSIQIQNSGMYDATTNAGSSADVFITLYNRSEAERALIERNHQKIAGNSIELFLSV